LIKVLYIAIRNLIIVFIALILILLYFLSGKEILPYLAQTYLKDYGISYSKIEGSIVDGFIIKDVVYEDSVKIKLLEVRYNPLSLVRLTPKLKLIRTQGLHVDTNFFLKNDSNSSQKIINFQITNLVLNNTEVLYEDKNISFTTNINSFEFGKRIKIANLNLDHATLKDNKNRIDIILTAKKLDYKKSLSIENFNITAETPYGEFSSENAQLNKNILIASAKVKLNQNLSSIYTKFIDGIPEVLDIDLNASLDVINIKTKLDKITLKEDQNLSLEKTALHVKYFIQSNYFEADTSYALLYEGFELSVKQNASFTTNLQFQSTAKINILESPINLPTKTVDISLSGDSSFMVADINSSNIQIVAKTYDYKQYSINSKTNKLPLSFIKEIPISLKDDLLTSKGDLVIDTDPLFLRGEIKVEDNHIITTNHIEIKDHSILVKGDIEAKKEAKVYNTFDLDLVSNLNFVYFKNKKQNLLNIDSKQINITIFENNHTLKGWGNLNNNNFKVSGNIAKKGQNNIKLFATFPSMKTLLKELKIKLPKTKVLYDAQVDINANIDFNENLKLKSTIEIPWFYIQPDEETTYAGQSAKFEIEKKGDELIIKKYQFELMGHKIDSKKTSIIAMDKNNTIEIKEFWVYDNLLITGLVDTFENSIQLKIKSDDFTYTSKDGNVSAKVDIDVSIDDNGEKIEGFITLLDGVITHIPTKDYSELDSDIIIIQNINERTLNNRFINIHVDSKKPIKYSIDNVDIDFTPDFSIYKENHSENITLLGLVTLNKGKIKAIDKTFSFKKSELYFYNENTNPKLNLNITHQTLDYIDINIFVAGNVEAPVIILSSNPTMSQDDIMSYILFGEATASSLNTSGDANSNKIYISSLLVGSSLKNILNKSDNINIDTINILTNDEGSLGYEIGTRINKDLRVIYKNNIISSVIVQYNINRAIRIDVDVDQDNRGISLVYIKDF